MLQCVFRQAAVYVLYVHPDVCVAVCDAVYVHSDVCVAVCDVVYVHADV